MGWKILGAIGVWVMAMAIGQIVIAVDSKRQLTELQERTNQQFDILIANLPKKERAKFPICFVVLGKEECQP